MRKIMFCLMIAMVFAAGTLSAESRLIQGVITDATDGSVLPGVIVVIRGTSQGTVSDLHGNYSIEIQQPRTVLVFSFIGMITQEITPGNSNRLDVAMYPEIAVLDEVIITGYGRHGRAMKLSANEVASAPAYQSGMPYVVAEHDFNTESYSKVQETGFRDAMINPLSTFSIDVDNAAYSNVRRFINGGQLPPLDAVRVEEMLNYFKYSYPQPAQRNPYAIYTELSQCPWNPQTQLLHVGLQGMNMEKSSLPFSNLVFLIDVSGSMLAANKLPLAQTAMKMLVEELRPQDRVALVVYASRTQVVLESTPAANKQKIISAIDGLTSGGSTAGGQGLRMAYEVAGKNFIEGGNNRIILCTDGDFNVGESSNASMERLVEDERKKGVFITVLGFGMGNYKDDRLEIIANKGNGNYGYIDNIQEARKMLVGEFAGTLFTIAKDVKLQIEFNPARVKAYRLIGYENRRLNNEDFNNDAKDAGEMGAGHSVTALYEIIPAGSEMSFPGIDALRYQSDPAPVRVNNSAELLTIKTRYKKPDGDESIYFDEPVPGRLLPLNRTSEDFRFAAAVAEFGLLLLDSPYKENASFENVLKLASEGKGRDEDGYRAEFINLVRTAQNLDRLSSR
jgi:Ca-activated chloride channel homolog